MSDQRTLATSMLERLGYRPESVAGADEALARLGVEPADLVLLDMIMDPGPDGLDTYRMLRQRDPAQRVVLMSGYSETARVREALALGAAAYLKKPYRIEDLARTVREAIGRG